MLLPQKWEAGGETAALREMPSWRSIPQLSVDPVYREQELPNFPFPIPVLCCIFALQVKMKRYAHTYCLFALVLTSINVFFFRKMDKHSFYHHYFKVIEEVELRNSQEITPIVPFWHQAIHALQDLRSQVLTWLLGLFTAFAASCVWVALWLLPKPDLVLAPFSSRVSWATPPVRAP